MLIRGTFVHTPDLGQLDILKDYLIGVSFPFIPSSIGHRRRVLQTGLIVSC
jgi:hypothetical protein